MEAMDPQQARRVWQRVRGQEEAEDLGLLIAGEWESTAMCLELARRGRGRFAPALERLAGNGRSRWACLQALALLRNGKRPRHTHPGSVGGTPREILTACYTAGLERYRQYCAGSEAYGPVMTTLAQEQLRDCRAMLELLGNWPD